MPLASRLVVCLALALCARVSLTSGANCRRAGPSYCSYLKQIDVDEFLGGASRGNVLLTLDSGLNSDLSAPYLSYDMTAPAESGDELLSLDEVLRTYTSEIVYSHGVGVAFTQRHFDESTYSIADKSELNGALNGRFKFKMMRNNTIQISLVDPETLGDQLGRQLRDRTLKFKLVDKQRASSQVCYLVLDFYDAGHYAPDMLELKSLIEQEKKSFIYYEAYSFRNSFTPGTGYLDLESKQLRELLVRAGGQLELDLKNVINGQLISRFRFKQSLHRGNQNLSSRMLAPFSLNHRYSLPKSCRLG